MCFQPACFSATYSLHTTRGRIGEARCLTLLLSIHDQNFPSCGSVTTTTKKKSLRCFEVSTVESYLARMTRSGGLTDRYVGLHIKTIRYTRLLLCKSPYLTLSTPPKQKTNTNYFHHGNILLRCPLLVHLEATECCCCCVFGSTPGGDTGDWRSRLRSRFFFPLFLSDRRRETRGRGGGAQRFGVFCFAPIKSIDRIGVNPIQTAFFEKGQDDKVAALPVSACGCVRYNTSSWLLSIIRCTSSELVIFFGPRDRVILTCEEIQRSFLTELDPMIASHTSHLMKFIG